MALLSVRDAPGPQLPLLLHCPLPGQARVDCALEGFQPALGQWLPGGGGGGLWGWVLARAAEQEALGPLGRGLVLSPHLPLRRDLPSSWAALEKQRQLHMKDERLRVTRL